MNVIIDCHGHFTTSPDAHVRWRDELVSVGAGGLVAPPYPTISDDELSDALESSQIPLMRQRGTDVTLFSPRASAMAHHIEDARVAELWARGCNDLIRRVVELYTDLYVGVAQLPQSPGAPIEACLPELVRSVEELGFVGCVLNPDPSGGRWTSPPLTDPYWFPIYEKLEELDVAAMIHPSASLNAAFHGTGDHYLNADTTAFMQLVRGDLFGRFPALRLVIPHGGGAVPYHWGRYRGLADMLDQPPIEQAVMPNVYFDTCVYHQAGIDLLFDTVDVGHILFGSEMVGAVRGVDPRSGEHFDDTKRYVDRVQLSEEERAQVYSLNALMVYPRLGRSKAVAAHIAAERGRGRIEVNRLGRRGAGGGRP